MDKGGSKSRHIYNRKQKASSRHPRGMKEITTPRGGENESDDTKEREMEDNQTEV